MSQTLSLLDFWRQPVGAGLGLSEGYEKHLINSHDRSPSMHQHQVFVELGSEASNQLGRKWSRGGAVPFQAVSLVGLVSGFMHSVWKVTVACRSQSDREVNRRWSTLPSAWWQAGSDNSHSKDIIEAILQSMIVRTRRSSRRWNIMTRSVNYVNELKTSQSEHLQ